MMHQSNKTPDTLVSIRPIENIACIKFIEKRHGLYIYLIENVGQVDEWLKVSVGETIIYYLDSFIIVLPDEYMKQSEMWKDFYKVFGSRYEEMINVSHNVKCIERMISYIDEVIGLNSSSKILDYGCGSGLSKSIAIVGSIIGYEPVHEMRIQACHKGLKALDIKEIEALPDYYFDAVFSSYVFHMAVSEDSIERILPKLKPGAIWIANYYKGLNESTVNNFFLEHDFQIKRVFNIQERFGNVYEYRKGSSSK